jgi:hypothetical protein
MATTRRRCIDGSALQGSSRANTQPDKRTGRASVERPVTKLRRSIKAASIERPVIAVVAAAAARTVGHERPCSVLNCRSVNGIKATRVTPLHPTLLGSQLLAVSPSCNH